MKINEILGAFLSSQGQHDAAAECYNTILDRTAMLRLKELAIRTAPEYNRTHVAFVLNRELDKPENGGADEAEIVEIKKSCPSNSGRCCYLSGSAPYEKRRS